MTPEEFRSHLARLGYSQVGFARRMGFDPRNVRRWARENDLANPIPLSVQMLLRGQALEEAAPEFRDLRFKQKTPAAEATGV